MKTSGSQPQLQLWPPADDEMASAIARVGRTAADESASPRSLAAVIEEHAVELTHCRRRLTGGSGAPTAELAWAREVGFFVREIIEPQLGAAAVGMFGPAALRDAIEAASTRYRQSRLTFDLDDDTSPFELRVADALEDLGWQVEVTQGSGSRQLDVMALMRERSVLVQCRYTSSWIAHSAVLDVYHETIAAGCDHSAVISNGPFSPRAHHHAACTRTLLLHQNELNRLEERIFGTERWRAGATRPPRR